MAITLTPAAAARVKTFLTKRGSGVGLRLGVKKTGCSGFAYTVEYADAVEQDDLAFESQGLTVVVRQEALALLDGTEVDFVREGLGEAFTFRNPNAQDECGCGESFSV